MTEHASQEEIINVSMPFVLETILELDNYCHWVDDVTKVSVIDRDSRGRPLQAKLETYAMGKNMVHENTYDYSSYPEIISWTLIEGDMVTELTGSYTLKEIDEHTTSVRYDLKIELSTPMPSFLKKKATNKIVSSALESLKTYCEKTFSNN